MAGTTTITDSNNVTHNVNLSWSIAGYDGNTAGNYTATGTFALPAGVDQSDPETELKVTATVTVNAAVSTDKTLNSITAPSAILGVANGTAKEAEALGLPTKVTMVTDQGNVQADVNWDVAACSYDPAVTTEQTFTVSGNVTLPTGVVNPNNVDLTTSISVTVKAQVVAPNPTITGITAVSNVDVAYGTAEADAIAALAGTTTITDSNNVTHTVNLSWSIASYDGNTADNYTATGTFTLPAGVDQSDPETELKVTAVVTVNAAVSTDKTLNSITAPSAITGVANGTAKTAKALGLPAKVTLVTSDGNIEADVTWDVASSNYDVSNKTQQIFTVNGTVTLPVGVVNPDSVPLTTSISVTVNVEVFTDKTLVSITAPSAITGVANGTAKTAEALGLPAKVTLITNDGDVQADVNWDVAACSYNPAVTTEQTFTVSGTVTLPADVVNPDNVDLTTSISVTVNAAVPTPTYALTITAGTGGSITTGNSGNYAAGTVITITATAASGYSFNKWTSIGGGTFANTNSASTTFTMPAGAAIITASFTYQGSGGGGGGGGGSSTTPSGSLVTSSGQTTSANGVTFTFPAGAVEKDIRVQVKEASLSAGMTLPDDSQLLSRIVDIIKDKSGNFLKPVTLTLTFDKSKIDAGEYDIAIYYYDEDSGKWIALDNIKLNLKAGNISGDTTHFTKFAVIATPKTKGKPSETTPPQPLNIPTDLAGHWAKDSIMKLINVGVVTGYPNGTFKPGKAVTRAEFTVMLVKALNLEAKAGKIFEDSRKHWAKDSISIAATHGIISGYNENTFSPDELITREQAAVIIARATKLELVTGELNFTDRQAISPWAKPGVAVAVKDSYISGYPDGSFRPQSNTTRAEAAVMIVKLR